MNREQAIGIFLERENIHHQINSVERQLAQASHPGRIARLRREGERLNRALLSHCLRNR